MAPVTSNITLFSSTAAASSIDAPVLPSALTIHPSIAIAGSFAGCATFPHPWDTNRAPQAYWPPQVSRGPGRACIGYPNHYMMECCGPSRRDYICGWEVCIGTTSDWEYEACFKRLADRDGRRDWAGDDSDDDMWHGQYVNNTRRGRKYSFTCASAGSRSAAPSCSGHSDTRAVLGAVMSAVAVAVFVTGL